MKRVLTLAGIALCLAIPAQAKTIRVGTKHTPPVVYTHKGQPSGFSIDVWESVARNLDTQTNYSNYKSIPDLLEAVRSGEVDAAIAAISVTAERERSGLDFSFPYYESGLQIVQSKNNEAWHLTYSPP